MMSSYWRSWARHIGTTRGQRSRRVQQEVGTRDKGKLLGTTASSTSLGHARRSSAHGRSDRAMKALCNSAE